jgi:chromosomal replication initiation ATPase DnaA
VAADERTPHFPDDLWGQALERFVAAAPEHWRVYDTWLARTALDGITETEVIVTAEDSFAAEWIAQKYRDPLASFVSAVAGRPLGLQVRAQGAAAPLRAGPDASPEVQPDLFGSGEPGR